MTSNERLFQDVDSTVQCKEKYSCGQLPSAQGLIGSCFKASDSLCLVCEYSFYSITFQSWVIFIACGNPGECGVRWNPAQGSVTSSVLNTTSLCVDHLAKAGPKPFSRSVVSQWYCGVL